MRLWGTCGLLALALSLSAPMCFAGETATLRNGFTIHFQHREPRGDLTRLYMSESADSFVDVPTDDIVEIETDSTPPATPKLKPQSTRPVHPVDLDQALSAASHNNNVSPELLRSVIRAESGFNPNARSIKGAQGLMQLMPATAARLGVKNPWDPEENLQGGARYLHELLGRYHNNVPVALAAYNAGPERVEQYHGIPPYPETLNYVSRILHDLNHRSVASGQTSIATLHRTNKPTAEALPVAPVLETPEQTSSSDNQDDPPPTENTVAN